MPAWKQKLFVNSDKQTKGFHNTLLLGMKVLAKLYLVRSALDFVLHFSKICVEKLY